jgi:hypothetical protein
MQSLASTVIIFNLCGSSVILSSSALIDPDLITFSSRSWSESGFLWDSKKAQAVDDEEAQKTLDE